METELKSSKSSTPQHHSITIPSRAATPRQPTSVTVSPRGHYLNVCKAKEKPKVHKGLPAQKLNVVWAALQHRKVKINQDQSSIVHQFVPPGHQVAALPIRRFSNVKHLKMRRDSRCIHN